MPALAEQLVGRVDDASLLDLLRTAHCCITLHTRLVLAQSSHCTLLHHTGPAVCSRFLCNPQPPRPLRVDTMPIWRMTSGRWLATRLVRGMPTLHRTVCLS